MEIHEDQPMVEPVTPTRTVEAQFISQRDYGAAWQIHPALVSGAAFAWASFRVPWDFTAWTSIIITLRPFNTANHSIELQYNGARNGEPWNTHNVTTTVVHALTANQLYEINSLADAPAFWAALTPGDTVTLRIRETGANSDYVSLVHGRYT